MSRDTRLFIRLDLDYPDHPKIMGLSDAAFRAHITMMAYARKYKTDGHISNPVANRLALQWDTDVLTELQSNDPENPSLIKLEDGGYELHGYADMQETRAEIEARQRRNAANGRKGGRPRKSRKTQSVTESDTQLLTDSGTQMKAETETETDTYTSGSADAETQPKTTDLSTRPDLTEILDYLDPRVEANGHRKPNRTQNNINAARLLIDYDKRTVEQVKAAIDFATTNEFWRSHIRSMSKLREKYETLQIQAQSGSSTSNKQGQKPILNQWWHY